MSLLTLALDPKIKQRKEKKNENEKGN